MHPVARSPGGHGPALAFRMGIQLLAILRIAPAMRPVEHAPVPHGMVGHLLAVEHGAAALTPRILHMSRAVHVPGDVDDIHQVQPHERIVHLPVVAQAVAGLHESHDTVHLAVAQGVDQLHPLIDIADMLDTAELRGIPMLVHIGGIVDDGVLQIAGDVAFGAAGQMLFGDAGDGVVTRAVPGN